MKYECAVRTPQFNTSGIIGYVEQYGSIDNETWTFVPIRLLSDGGTGIGIHRVHFRSKENFLKAQIK